MEQLVDSYKKSKNLHHAYFLVGDREEVFLKLKDFLEKNIEVKTSSNPDFWHGKFNTLKIDEARDITESSGRKSFESSPSTSSGSTTSSTKKIFVISTDFITEEAQNSLLKVFEEPTDGTHFFIISPQDILLPTLRSRMQVVFNLLPEQSEGNNTNKALVAIGSILKLKFKDRLEKVKEIIDAIKDEEATKQDAILLLNQIEKELYDIGVDKFSSSLEICEKARISLYDRGAPIKIILENVMLSI